MNKTLTVIIPVSKHESLETIQHSINVFKTMDFFGFDTKIVYAIDLPNNTRPYYQNLKIDENMELLWVIDTTLKQAGAYNAGLRKYPSSDYYAFFDIDAVPSAIFFRPCLRIDADFVSCDRHVSNSHQNKITETVREEYDFCNLGRVFMYENTGKFFPASCTGLIRGEVMRNFRFTEKTGADTELYQHILYYDFSMGYATDVCYYESAPTSLKQLYAQRLRWLSDGWRTCAKTVGCGKNWKENIYNLGLHMVGMFPLIGGILAIPRMKHVMGYNMLIHAAYMQGISLLALANVISNKEIKWEITDK